MTLKSFYPVRFNDCDPFGHLNNARYIDYMLNAREDHLQEYYQLDLKHFQQNGMGWVVRHHDIQYVRPAVYGERVAIVSNLLELADSHLVVEMLMFNEEMDVLKAILWTKFTCINLRTGKKEKHTDDFMTFARDKVVPGIDVAAGIRTRMKSFFNPA